METILLLVRERAYGCVEILNLDTNTNVIIAKVLNLNSLFINVLAHNFMSKGIKISRFQNPMLNNRMTEDCRMTDKVTTITLLRSVQ